ncbi:MAG: hypothetical protein AAGF11_15745 [Myxococcota bacterium]
MIEPLVDRLQLRRPEDELHVLEANMTASMCHARIHIERTESDGYDLQVRMSDGRLYRRSVRAVPDDAARTLAADLAVLLQGIEQGTVTPSGEDPKPNPVTEPMNSSPKWALGASPGVVLGLAPAAPARSGLAGGLTIDGAYRPRRLWFGAQLRLLARTRAALTLLRIRVAFGLGYTVQTRAPFELHLSSSLGIEPWTIRGLQSPGLRADGQTQRPGPLLGITAGVRPRYVAPWRGGNWSLGGVAALGLSGDITRGLGTPRVIDDGSDLLRLGGLELWLGAEATMTFEIARRTTR